MTLPDSIDIDIDDIHVELYDRLPEEAKETVVEFVEQALSDRVDELVEESIWKQYQEHKKEDEENG